MKHTIIAALLAIASLNVHAADAQACAMRGTIAQMYASMRPLQTQETAARTIRATDIMHAYGDIAGLIYGPLKDSSPEEIGGIVENACLNGKKAF